MTVTEPEVGRLDRILAAHRASIATQVAAMSPHHRDAFEAALAYAEARTPDEVRRLRSIAVSLESEVAALTDALTKRTHEFEPLRDHPDECDYGGYDCSFGRSHPVHRTPARVRAEIEQAAT